MKRPFLSNDAKIPVTLPDGTVLENLVYLNQVVDHPNIDIGDYTYFNSFVPVPDYAIVAGNPAKVVRMRF